MGASTGMNDVIGSFIPKGAHSSESRAAPQDRCGPGSCGVSLSPLELQQPNFHGLYGWLTAYPTLPQPTVEA